MSLPKLLDEMVVILNKIQALDDEANAHWQEQAPPPENYSWQRAMGAAGVRRAKSPTPIRRNAPTGEGISRHATTGYERRFKRILINSSRTLLFVLSLFVAGRSAFGQAELKLSWNHAVTHQLGFQAERVGNGESRLLEYGATQRSAIDSGLKKNTRYEYRLRALYDEGESEWTPWVKGKTQR